MTVGALTARRWPDSMNRDDIGLLIFPRLDECMCLAALPRSAAAQEIVSAPAVRAFFSDLQAKLNRESTGSATRINRMRLMDIPPSLDRGEITDKGSINQRAVLTHRAALVEAMYQDGERDPGVIIAHGSH